MINDPNDKQPVPEGPEQNDVVSDEELDQAVGAGLGYTGEQDSSGG